MVEYRKHILHAQRSFIYFYFLLFITLVIIPVSKTKAQNSLTYERPDTSFVYDEIPVLVLVEGYGSFYIDVIYTDNDLLYINIEDLFKTLKIACFVGQKGDSLGGFIENEGRTYLISFDKKQVKVGDKIIKSKNGLLKEMGAVYMESSLFGEAFGITMTFNFRALTIILKSEFELPVIKQQRIEKIQSNLAKFKGEEIVDTILHRNYHLFRFGTLDWSAASFQTWNGSTDNRLGVGIGTELLYGEADVSVNYYNKQKLGNRQLQYLWRWVDNDKSLIKQAQVGKISNQTISFINSQIIGAVIRNSPTTVRKASGYYTINAFTEPNWTVELYINNVLVDYTKADVSGLYVFKVPIVYGYTILKLKFYGTMGEERTEERSMNIPYTVMTAKKFEYGLSAGLLQDSSLSRFGKADFNYGVTRFFTVGGGVEYLSSIPKAALIPYTNFTWQPFSKLLINGEYDHGVKARGLLNYGFTKNASIEIDYTRYKKGQLATRFSYLEERKVKLSLPCRINKLIVFAKLDYTQFVYSEFRYNLTNIMLSSYYKQFSSNTSAQLNWIDKRPAYVTVDQALSYRMSQGLTIRSSAQYNISEGNFVTCKAEIEKKFPKGCLSAIYERNVTYDDNFVNVTFKYDLSFTRINSSVTHSNGKFTTSESAQGSLAFGGGNKYVYVSNNSSVDKGGISLYPFLDLNNNDIFDKGERLVKLSSVRVMGGKVIFRKNDSIIRIPDLNPFTYYTVGFSDKDLENIAWRFKNKLCKVLIDPNQFKRIDIPIIVVGEVSGTAFFVKENLMKGIGRILIKFYEKNSNKVVAETLSESDGYIYYMGLTPGEYVARVDSVQLSKLNFTVDPPQIDFSVKATEDGDIIEGLDFVLHARQIESLDKKK